MARSLSDLPPRQQWVVAGVLSLALVVIYYMQFWSSYEEQIERHVSQVAEMRTEVRRMELIAQQLPEAEEELQTLETRLEILSNILPEEYETAELLRGVGTLAAQSNLVIRDLAFQDPVPYEFYAESPIELELTGTYHDLARFFDRVAKFARIINVDEVDITAEDDGSDPGTTVRATVTAKTFIFIDEPREQADQEQGS